VLLTASLRADLSYFKIEFKINYTNDT
jgi:hypothetical protein